MKKKAAQIHTERNRSLRSVRKALVELGTSDPRLLRDMLNHIRVQDWQQLRNAIVHGSADSDLKAAFLGDLLQADLAKIDELGRFFVFSQPPHVVSPRQSAIFPKSLKTFECMLRILVRGPNRKAAIGDLREDFHSYMVPEYGRFWAKFLYLCEGFWLVAGGLLSKLKKLAIWGGVVEFLRRIAS